MGVGIAPDLAGRALDALDTGIAILSADLRALLHLNAHARSLFGGPRSLPPAVSEAVEAYVLARRNLRHPPPAIRVEHGERGLYIRAVASLGDPPVEVVFIREEVVRDVDAFRLLEGRHGISRREFQIIGALRLGKTNRQIAGDLGLAEGTVARHVHRLLERLGAPNRTRLVDMIEQLIARRT